MQNKLKTTQLVSSAWVLPALLVADQNFAPELTLDWSLRAYIRVQSQRWVLPEAVKIDIDSR